jgi:GTP cyclohydrolase IB
VKDVQNFNDDRGIRIQSVGVTNFKLPLSLPTKAGGNQGTIGNFSFGVSLPKDFKGTHMSRFIEILSEAQFSQIYHKEFNDILKQACRKLSASVARLIVEFDYFLEKESPVSKLTSISAYKCQFEAYLNKDKYSFPITTNVNVTSVCPCSKEISSCGAHNQRALITLMIDPIGTVWLEDMINLCESCGSSQVYSLLKRNDEKFLTEQAYNNPKFVEDILRDVVLKCQQNQQFKWFKVNVNSEESIHGHNAFAYYDSLGE